MFIKLIMEKLMLKQQKEKKLKENHSIVSMIMAYLNVILFIFICIWRYLNKKEESSYQKNFPYNKIYIYLSFFLIVFVYVIINDHTFGIMRETVFMLEIVNIIKLQNLQKIFIIVLKIQEMT